MDVIIFKPKKADTLFRIFKNQSKEQMALFKEEVDKGIVKVIEGAHHYAFISNPVEIEQLIREFLI